MADKSPTFQFYPRDWDTDINVIPMTLEEEGVYWALCRLYWINGPLPADLNELRLLVKGRPAGKKMERWWTRIGKCFIERDGRLYHKRLDHERAIQEAWRVKSSDAGRKSAEVRRARFGSAQPDSRTTVRTNPEPPFEPPFEPTPEPLSNSSSSSSSSSSYVPSEDLYTEKGRAGPPAADARAPESLMNAWNEITSPPIPKCLKLSKSRRIHALNRLKEAPLTEWIDVFTRIAHSPFCTGNGTRKWRATFDWVIGQRDVRLKVLEGNYPPTETDAELQAGLDDIYGRKKTDD